MESKGGGKGLLMHGEPLSALVGLALFLAVCGFPAACVALYEKWRMR